MRARVIAKGSLGNGRIQWGNDEWADKVPDITGEIVGFSGTHIQFLRDGDPFLFTIDTRLHWVEVRIEHPPI